MIQRVLFRLSCDWPGELRLDNRLYELRLAAIAQRRNGLEIKFVECLREKEAIARDNAMFVLSFHSHAGCMLQRLPDDRLLPAVGAQQAVHSRVAAKQLPSS